MKSMQWQQPKPKLKDIAAKIYDMSITSQPRKKQQRQQLLRKPRTPFFNHRSVQQPVARPTIASQIRFVWCNQFSLLMRVSILLHCVLFCYFISFSYYYYKASPTTDSSRRLHDSGSSTSLPIQVRQASLRRPSNTSTSVINSLKRYTKITSDKFLERTANDMKTRFVVSDMMNFNPVTTSKSNGNKEIILVVIISDRYEGIIPTVASILTNTKSKLIDLVLISNNHDVNVRVQDHFMNNDHDASKTIPTNRASIHKFTYYSIAEIQTDLTQQGYQPIWTWEEWGSSRSADWFRTDSTIHVATWDVLETHAHVLNHLRFYLPHVSHFHNYTYLYFVDDDVLVQKDLGMISDMVVETLDSSKGIITPCNIWLWDNTCHTFGFQNVETISSILQMPSLYGDRKVCRSQSEQHCYPSTYPAFLESMIINVTNTTKTSNIDSSNPRNQKAWNFGFSLFALDNWRQLDLTSRYETVMKESYRHHIFPETSLTFGLGVPYIAFAGAVECWNDNIIKVRDGFGFIEYNRFAETFGDQDFINTKVDVIHYTGPTKPWIVNSTIESRSIQPWLNYMQNEGMNIPTQIPDEKSKQLFTLLSSERAGAQWVMSLLDNHPSVCASGETQKPESGFPVDVMQPWGTPWLPICSIKRGCSFAYIYDAIHDLVGTMDRRGRTNRMPPRCQTDYKNHNDELGHHLPRICNFFRSLNGNFTDSAVAAKWVEAFRDEDEDLLPCSCPRGTLVKGVKVFAEWLLYENYPHQPMGPADMVLHDTALSGSKIIRLKRRNLWERYLSSVIAQQSNVYHAKSQGEKADQLRAAGNVTISISDMLAEISDMEAIDLAGDNWAKQHASNLLEVYHEDCKLNTAACFRQIFEFLGVDPSFVTAKQAIFEPVLASAITSTISVHINNKGAVEEALAENGYGKHIGVQNFAAVQLLIFDDSETVDKTLHFQEEKGIDATIFGQEDGVFPKFAAALPLLKSMAPDTIVVLSDNSDVRTSFPAEDDFTRYDAINDFRKAIHEMLQESPGAIVASTETHCCASALTHTKLGGLFQADGTRKSRSCVSGQPGCEWAGDDKAAPWQRFMKDLAVRRGYADTDSIYLDGSLIGGKASDMLVFIRASQIGEKEDVRAVITDYMFHNPNKIILDYDLKLFGKKMDGVRYSANNGCPFKTQSSAAARLLQHPNSMPLFMHAPRELGCVPGKNGTENPIYPRWAETGIQIKPILDHIDRVEHKVATITSLSAEPIYYQGPEILYFVDETGVWTSKLIRDRTDNATLVWRTEPTEGLIYKAYQILKNTHTKHQRWSLARKALKTGGFPYWAWYGDFKSCNFQNYGNNSIPLFTTCALATCDHAFPIPNYMNVIDSQPSSDNWRGLFRDTEVAKPWKSKIRKVVWRGSLSDSNGDLVLSSVRWLANKLVHNLNSSLYDVGLTSIPSWVSSQVSVNISEVGGLVNDISPMSEFQQYIAILDMDGNSWSSRFASLLCYNSVIIKVESKYAEYFYSSLHPWTHYIPVKADLSDLHENVEWALNPDNEANVLEIIVAANDWCMRRMVPDELAHDLLNTWESYVLNLNHAEANWQKQWLSKKSSILSSTSALNLFKLRPKLNQ